MPEKTCLDHPTSRISSKQAHFPQFYTICFFTRGGFMHQHPLLFLEQKCIYYRMYTHCAKVGNKNTMHSYKYIYFLSLISLKINIRI